MSWLRAPYSGGPYFHWVAVPVATQLIATPLCHGTLATPWVAAEMARMASRSIELGKYCSCHGVLVATAMLLLSDTAHAHTALPGLQGLAGTVGVWAESPTKLFRLIQTPRIHAPAMTSRNGVLQVVESLRRVVRWGRCLAIYDGCEHF